MRENRKYERHDMMLDVEVVWPGHGAITGTTDNVSDGGVLVTARFAPEQPPVGTVLNARVLAAGDGVEPPLLSARVIRSTGQILALEFIRE